MKMVKLLLASVLLVIIMQGCGRAAEDAKNDVENAAEDVKHGTENIIHNDRDNNVNFDNVNNVNFESYPFEVIKLTAKYNNGSYKLHYYNNGMEDIKVEVKDEINDVEYKGEEAIRNVKPGLDQLKFDKSESDDEIIRQVLEAFNLKRDYKKIELEIKYTDGTVKHYKS